MRPNKVQFGDTEVRGEKRKHSVLDIIDQARENFERGLMLDDWGAVAEAYADQRAEVHVHFCIRHVSNASITGHYCAVFNRTGFGLHSYRPHHPESANGEGSSRWQDQLEVGQAILVNVGKAVNEPEGVACTLIPSTVRLQNLDSCLRSWGDAPDFAFALAPKGSSGHADWERGVIGYFTGKRLPLVGGDCEFIGDVVESGADVADAIAKYEGKPSGGLLEDLNLNDILAGIRIRFVDEAIWLWVSFPPSAPSVLKASQVFPRPA